MLNRRRLAQRPGSAVADYGTPPASPTYSVIVPLYGRLNYVEYQLALFSAHPGAREVEFIYVLDDPGKRREAQALFAAAYECFGIPCRAVLLDRNVGFAPACNIGLEHATGTFVAYVNSDVFPGTPDWLDRLAAHLEADPALGVVGPVLLFEDGSVQHRGMDFVRQREFGDWFFPIHGGKGMRRGQRRGLSTSLSITGACMLMRRTLAKTAGGFDEIYAIGDFEDSDLCLKLRALGYGCAVDEGVELYHLERRSQASSALGWRMNLTLYNAWQHERRWGTTIAAHQHLAGTHRAGTGRAARRAADR
jgi:GT2 family glycosyltransferase